MQLTNIDERGILLKIRFTLWILSFLLELLDGIFVSDVRYIGKKGKDWHQIFIFPLFLTSGRGNLEKENLK